MHSAIDQTQKATIEDFESLIHILSGRARDQKMAIPWDQVSFDVHRRLLFAICRELCIPNPHFIQSRDIEKQRFRFANNEPLNGLYFFYKTAVPREKENPVIANVCTRLGIPRPTAEEWMEYIRRGGVIQWKSVPLDVQRQILLTAAAERGYSHPICMTNKDFSMPFRFLNDKTLSGLLSYYKQNRRIHGSLMKTICEHLSIEIREEDWLSYIACGSASTYWDMIPKTVIRSLLINCAGELGYTNPRMMSINDLKRSFACLKDLSLYSFASRFFGRERKGTGIIDFICDQYEIPPLSYDEWIFMISSSQNFKWEYVPHDVIYNLLLDKAREAKKSSPRLLKYEDFVSPTGFLNNKSLIGLYTCYSGKIDAGADTVKFLCDLAGIPELSTQQWLEQLKSADSKIQWNAFPKAVIKEILLEAARELKLKSPRLMGYKDFCTHPFQFLGGKTLSGLYAHFVAIRPEGGHLRLQELYDKIGIDRLSTDEWIEAIASSPACHWDNIPGKVQREIVIMAAVELGVYHPRLMDTRDFDVKLKFLGDKALSGLYSYYASKAKSGDRQVKEMIFDSLEIPRIDINPKTGRLTTIESIAHRKYFDSIANFKEFVDRYLKQFDLQSLCHKNTALKNAKKAGIYKKGLVTLLSSMDKRQYIEFLYGILKSVPRDLLGFRKTKNGDYVLRKADLYSLAGIPEQDMETTKIQYADPDRVSLRSKEQVLSELSTYKAILDIKIKKYHKVECTFLVSYKQSLIFTVPVIFFPGDLVTSDRGHELEILECREHKSNDLFILEMKPLSKITDEEASKIRYFQKDSNDAILSSNIDALMENIKKGTASNLLSVVLGLKKEEKLDGSRIKMPRPEQFINKDLLCDEAQKQSVALANTLDGEKYALALIQGPPGTGKTTLIKEIALQQYYQGKNILILAKTNVAVDNILEKLIPESVRVLRTGNNIEYKSALPYAYAFSSSNQAYMEKLKGENRIVLGTPMGFYLDRNMNNQKSHYDMLIIDEASQMDVPESLFSLTFADKCVIIGDHLQIPPFPIQNDILLEYNPNMGLQEREDLQKSLFEKLITDPYCFNRVFLDTSYRTDNPQIVSLISDLIYDGKLCPNLGSEYYRTPKSQRASLFPDKAIEIVDTSKLVHGDFRMETEINSTYFNLCEAMISVKKVMDLLKEGEKLKDICIITPYKAQTEKIKELFQSHYRSFIKLKADVEAFVENNIFTIDSFQGREAKNIIISWVRSNRSSAGMATKTGFLRDYRRVNVALSRAKQRLILIGDFDTLTRSDNMNVRYIFSKLRTVDKRDPLVF